MATRFIDLSHTIQDGMTTYPGLPAPKISDHLSRADSRSHYAAGTEFHIGKIEMVANTGTYLDAPFHRFEDRTDIAGLPLTSLADLPGIVVRVSPDGGRAIGAQVFDGLPLSGRAVLVHTGWAIHFGSQRYFEGHPFLTEAAARHLSLSGAALVGIDSLNIDDTAAGHRPVHTHLLDQGIPIVEHLTHLESLPEAGFRFFAVPVKVEALGSFPVRAFAIIED